MSGKNEQLFMNKVTMNEYTIREISLDLWSYKKGKNKSPVILLLVAILCPVIYAFLNGTKDAILLIVPILVIGLISILVYVRYTAHKAAKDREKMIVEMIEKHGKNAVLSISFAEEINYKFCGKNKTVSYSDVKEIIELDMYLVLVLKNKVQLPIWKAGFEQKNWNKFIPFFKQKMKNR